MMITEIFRWQSSDPLWGLAVWCLFPLILVEIVFLILGGVILRSSAAKAGKGWGFGAALFVLGVGLECGLARLLRLLLPYEYGTVGYWLLGIVVALILVGIISYGMFRLFEWMDCAIYDHYKKTESFQRLTGK